MMYLKIGGVYVCYLCFTVGVIITTHPVDQFINVSDDVTFICEASGSFPITYQWLYNGIELLDHPQYISGANTSTIMISNTNITQWGSYSCIASNIVNNATSNEATLHSKYIALYSVFMCELQIITICLCFVLLASIVCGH